MANSDPFYKVLVIDDECGPRESLRILLKKEYDVYCAASVDEGIELLREQKPDAVVLDIRMPDKSGLEGLREIRDIDPYVSIIMLTGFGTLESAQEALRRGANDYLKKPFDAVNMQSIIRQQIRRSQLERIRAETLMQLQHLNSKLVHDLERKKHMASLGQTAAELMHDLRSPLTAILGCVEMLQDQLQVCRKHACNRCIDLQSYMDLIEGSVRRCRDMMDMWQSVGHKGSHGRKKVQMHEILWEVIKATESIANRSGVNVGINLEGDELPVSVDETQIFRAINNVVVNAVQAVAEKKGRVQLKCSQLANMVEVSISDDGCGIAEGNMVRIFEPYFTTKEFGKGTGLGLFITRKIIEEHQGTINVNSREGEGTTFTIRLPIHA